MKDRLLVILLMKKSFKPPSYVTVRAHISQDIYTGEVSPEDYEKLRTDPSVESLEMSRNVFAI